MSAIHNVRQAATAIVSARDNNVQGLPIDGLTMGSAFTVSEVEGIIDDILAGRSARGQGVSAEQAFVQFVVAMGHNVQEGDFRAVVRGFMNKGIPAAVIRSYVNARYHGIPDGMRDFIQAEERLRSASGGSVP